MLMYQAHRRLGSASGFCSSFRNSEFYGLWEVFRAWPAFHGVFLFIFLLSVQAFVMLPDHCWKFNKRKQVLQYLKRCVWTRIFGMTVKRRFLSYLSDAGRWRTGRQQAELGRAKGRWEWCMSLAFLGPVIKGCTPVLSVSVTLKVNETNGSNREG